jgi:hypothetical protein
MTTQKTTKNAALKAKNLSRNNLIRMGDVAAGFRSSSRRGTYRDGS